jgi:hypothetical protein
VVVSRVQRCFLGFLPSNKGLSNQRNHNRNSDSRALYNLTTNNKETHRSSSFSSESHAGSLLLLLSASCFFFPFAMLRIRFQYCITMVESFFCSRSTWCGGFSQSSTECNFRMQCDSLLPTTNHFTVTVNCKYSLHGLLELTVRLSRSFAVTNCNVIRFTATKNK